MVTLTFGLYAEAEGGTPLWTEPQTVTPDAEGRYAIEGLGSGDYELSAVALAGKVGAHVSDHDECQIFVQSDNSSPAPTATTSAG